MIRRFPALRLFGAIAIFAAFGSSAQAAIRQADLKKKVVVTEQAALLQQVDTVSLYLTSPRVSLAPRLKGEVIEVEATVLDPALSAKPAKAKEFVARLIETFISTLAERLPVYAPDIAERFDREKDVRFIVNAGKARAPVGVWEGGGWQPSASAALPAAAEAPATAAAAAPEEEVKESPPPSPKGCGCPARQ